MEFSAGNSSRSSSHDEGMQMISLTIGTLQVTTEQNPRSPSSTPDRTSPAASPASSAPRDCGAITAVNITRYPAPTPEHPDAAGVVPPATSQRVGVVLAGCDSGASEAGVRTPGSSAPAPVRTLVRAALAVARSLPLSLVAVRRVLHPATNCRSNLLSLYRAIRTTTLLLLLLLLLPPSAPSCAYNPCYQSPDSQKKRAPVKLSFYLFSPTLSLQL